MNTKLLFDNRVERLMAIAASAHKRHQFDIANTIFAYITKVYANSDVDQLGRELRSKARVYFSYVTALNRVDVTQLFYDIIGLQCDSGADFCIPVPLVRLDYVVAILKGADRYYDNGQPGIWGSNIYHGTEEEMWQQISEIVPGEDLLEAVVDVLDLKEDEYKMLKLAERLAERFNVDTSKFFAEEHRFYLLNFLPTGVKVFNFESADHLRGVAFQDMMNKV